jgi:hypothetical protein
MPATVASVRTFLGLTPARPADDDALAAAVAAANDAVATWRVDLPPDDGSGSVTWPPACDQAATQYAARLYGRRSSVQGVAAFQEVGVTAIPQDPDVAALLGLGRHQKSVVA